ncbi:Signal transduction histidine kinase with PAS domain [Halorhabdus sp. SVX81]|uniref:PAS domain-containing sensor histidine kinase n=1 Tax=Halorhabdus sp. SVX81 TaxID=2978283 RepID=UPI0023DA21F1|nr:PAS domain-containing sensor histidine kinase [Halorhabdus sp. SVX81]WEL18538.1 Signal transduction histidine kinase with PAS domain [Halorhabdus sp. SVX81]
MTDAPDRYGLLFELTEDAVAEIEMVENVPVVRTVNPGFVETFGYDRATIVGESLNDFIVPTHRTGEAATFDQRTAEGEANWATVTRQTADGLREFRYRGVPFEHEGGSHGLAIYTDITDRNRQQRHHEVLHRVLRHNLRNDLSQILLSTDALLDVIEDDDLRAHLTRIRAAADDLEELSAAAGRVRDILGDGSPDRSTVDLASTLRNVVDRHAASAEAVAFETDLPETLPVTGDRRLFEALDALVENAVEHGSTSPPSQAPEDAVEHGSTTPDSQARQDAVEHNPTPPTVTRPRSESRSTIRIAAHDDGEQAVATITDHGPGIPEFARAAVFDDRPISQLSHSSGLGLWLAKWLVESYGGELGYERRGDRTTVSVILPDAE